MQQRQQQRQRERQKSNKSSKTTTLKVDHAFLYISLLLLHDYNSHFLEDGNKRQQLSFSFPELWCSPLEFNSKKNWQNLTNETRWNKRDKVWGSANSLFKWRFRSRRRRRCVNSLFLPQPDHVHYRFSLYNYHVRKKGTESEHSRKFLAMEHLGKRTARQTDYNYRTKTCLGALSWIKFKQ